MTHRCGLGDKCPEFDQDPIITATIALEVAVDEHSAAAYGLAVKAASYGYHPLASTKAQDARWLKGLQDEVTNAVRDFFNAVQDAGVESSAVATGFARTVAA